jgi:hypothetical protein
MSGYSATGRISRAQPRFVGPGRGWTADDRNGALVDDIAAGPVHDPRPMRERLTERWCQAREEWGQATFFLFDPNSWR